MYRAMTLVTTVGLLLGCSSSNSAVSQSGGTPARGGSSGGGRGCGRGRRGRIDRRGWRGAKRALGGAARGAVASGPREARRAAGRAGAVGEAWLPGGTPGAAARRGRARGGPPPAGARRALTEGAAPTVGRAVVPVPSRTSTRRGSSRAPTSAGAGDQLRRLVVEPRGLPHSFSLPYFVSPNFYQGYGWYRKHFTVPSSWSGKEVFIEFQAAYDQAEVYLNGTQVGTQHAAATNGFSDRHHVRPHHRRQRGGGAS